MTGHFKNLLGATTKERQMAKNVTANRLENLLSTHDHGLHMIDFARLSTYIKEGRAAMS
jgi:hypothetical protein